MNRKKIRILLVGDVLTPPFANIAKIIPEIDVEMSFANIDQHLQILLSNVTHDVLISHATHQYFNPTGDMSASQGIAEEYCAKVMDCAARNRTLIIVNTIMHPLRRLVGEVHIAQRRATARINDMLCACADKSPMVSVVDLASVIARIGADKAINLQNDLVMRMPYTGHALPHVIHEYGRAIRERFLPRKKAVLLDADNTLWGGIIGEDGVAGIDIGPSYPGIVHRRFQQSLLELRSSGVLLCLVSKNNEADVREAFEKLEMPLKWGHFTAARVNWKPKSENIAAIAGELKLGFESLVLVDDNPFEIEEVQHALPAVDRYLFDARNADEALSLVYRIRDLSTWSLTAEDRQKANQYSEEIQRKNLRDAVGSLEDYLRSLNIKLEVGINRASQIKRISQLTNKTNQFNLTTRRYSEAEIIELQARGQVFDFRVTDRFGDMGIVGIVIVLDGEIDSFLMSCRALGRKVENLMLKHVCEVVGSDPPLRARFVPTPKNGMVEDFYDHNGFELETIESGVKHYRFSQSPIGGVLSVEILEITS